MKEAILVIGYNNTRINDVKKIREKAKQISNAVTVLCKKDLTDMDKAAVDYAVDVGLEQTLENMSIVLDFCKYNNLNIIGVLPFSDQGTQLGALIARQLGLPGADLSKVSVALNKHKFREKESSIISPKGYIPVNAKPITSLNELKIAFKEFNSAIFIKPMTEGNSRGCMAIKKYEDCEPAWEEIKKYLPGGITVEALVENAHEYSWEHVAGYSWITEKKTTNSKYRAEPQHILPAPISSRQKKLLTDGAKFMGEISGYNGCACHNEIFLLHTKNEVKAVEPNLRPAGAKIWDLGTHAFENFDPWEAWIHWATGKIDNKPKKLHQKSYAGLRFITSKKNGQIKNINISDINQLSKTIPGNYIELQWTKKIGEHVTSMPQDNADFIGYVTAKSESYDSLLNTLLWAEELLANNCIIEEMGR